MRGNASPGRAFEECPRANVYDTGTTRCKRTAQRGDGVGGDSADVGGGTGRYRLEKDGAGDGKGVSREDMSLTLVGCERFATKFSRQEAIEQNRQESQNYGSFAHRTW